MSQQAPQIPNLNSLRGQRGGLRGLAARRGPPRDPDHVVPQEDPSLKRDKIIQQTDNDALTSRMAAVALNYLDDPYSRPFITSPIVRRYPIINRGTYCRIKAIDRLVDSFLDTDPTISKQIISLGAGSDTRFFRRARKNLTYHEFDFAANTAVKIATIQRTDLLKDIIHKTLEDDDDPAACVSINEEKTALYSPSFNVHPLDLRDLTQDSLKLPNLDPSKPTLILSECCLCYIPPEVTDKILENLTAFLRGPIGIIFYEPIRPFDAFGKTMSQNLSSRGIELRTVKKYYSLGAQRERLKKAGFVTGQGARGIDEIYYGTGEEAWLPEGERNRVEGLEWLDEVEEWKLLGKHYCVAWAWRDCHDNTRGPLDTDIFSRSWTHVKGGYTNAERDDDVALTG